MVNVNGNEQGDKMKGKKSIKYLFLDNGGVLLTDGWVHGYRKLAAKTFELDQQEMEKRHNQAFDTYELGKLNTGGVHCGI